jgi:hypothetical protein
LRTISKNACDANKKLFSISLDPPAPSKIKKTTLVIFLASVLCLAMAEKKV